MRATRPIWVVDLDNLNKRNPKKDKVIVRAETKEKAIASGRANSVTFRNMRSHAAARLADPVLDLGMKKTTGPALKKFRLLKI